MSFSEITKKYRASLTDKECASLDIIGAELVNTNAVMNLTALTDEKGVGLLHFWDSLTLIDTNLFKGKRVIDVGCGGGFPSLPLALCARTEELTFIYSGFEIAISKVLEKELRILSTGQSIAVIMHMSAWR